MGVVTEIKKFMQEQEQELQQAVHSLQQRMLEEAETGFEQEEQVAVSQNDLKEFSKKLKVGLLLSQPSFFL